MDVEQFCKHFSVIPLDSDKSPLTLKVVNGEKKKIKWKEYQTKKIATNKLTSEYFGIVCGYDNLEVIDIDNHFDDADKLYEFIIDNYNFESFPIIKTQGGGYHIYYKCTEQVEGNQKLASRINLKGRPETLVETRGFGGYVVAPPSPGYEVINGDLFNVPTISKEQRNDILSICKSLDEIPEVIEEEVKEMESFDGMTPIEAYHNDPSSVEETRELLRQHGWQSSNGKHWVRPGKKSKDGISATFGTRGQNKFYVFSSNAHPFEPNDSYTMYYVKAILEFHGDFAECTKALGDRYGIKVNKKEPVKVKAEVKEWHDLDEDKYDTFWETFEDRKGKTKIVFKIQKYLDWLKKNGIYRYTIDRDNYILIKIKNNIVKGIYGTDVRNLVFDYIKSLPEWLEDGLHRETLQDWVYFNEKKFFGSAAYDLLKNVNVKLYKDRQNESILFFKNTAIKVYKDKLTLVDYSQLDFYIWDTQIIDRDFNILDDFNTDFEKFISNILGDNEHNIQSLCTALGFLLHRYKSLSFSPAIVLNDKLISDDPNGGTGKGIIAKAISKFKNTVTLNGKSFRFDKSFAFQRIGIDTELLVFDDVDRNFSFENLFSVITEGIPIERKGKDEFFINFEDSPKILITTNYTLKGEGNSIERRKIDFELEQYYRKDFTPLDEFGKLLFDDWDKTEWLNFDNFMIRCIQEYFLKGIIKPKNENIEYKRLISNTNPDFIDWFKDCIKFDEEIKKSDFHQKFMLETNLRKVGAKTLTKWIKKYCEYNRYEYRDVVNGERYFVIINKNNTEAF